MSIHNYNSFAFSWASYDGEWTPVLNCQEQIIGFRACGTDCSVSVTGQREDQGTYVAVSEGELVRVNGNVLTIQVHQPTQKDAA